jgi:hypothetical protein
MQAQLFVLVFNLLAELSPRAGRNLPKPFRQLRVEMRSRAV